MRNVLTSAQKGFQSEVDRSIYDFCHKGFFCFFFLVQKIWHHDSLTVWLTFLVPFNIGGPDVPGGGAAESPDSTDFHALWCTMRQSFTDSLCLWLYTADCATFSTATSITVINKRCEKKSEVWLRPFNITVVPGESSVSGGFGLKYYQEEMSRWNKL